MAIPEKPGWESPLARALYAYLSSGDNQLSFLEGDIIALMGDRNKGWQFGENLRTQCSGWFPLAYTELITEGVCSPTHRRMDSVSTTLTSPATPSTPGMTSASTSHSGKPSLTTMFGDTLLHRRVVKQTPHRAMLSTCASLCPPPSLPAPVPESAEPLPARFTTTAIVHPPHSHAHPPPLLSPRGDAATLPGKRAVHPPPMPPLPLHLGGKRANGTPGSLHSSNDSGFSNDPPPQPEVDYSDDDSARNRISNGNQITDQSEHSKKQLLSSVRGWLLYKSALDLWEDVNEQAETTDGKHAAVGRTMSTRHIGENKVATLGRFGSQDLLKPTPVAVDKVPVIPTPKPTVKRTKSLWKFKRSNKNDILEGMSLWKHRSLIDVYKTAQDDVAVSQEDEDDDKTENIYASAEAIQTEKQKYIEKLKNDKNSSDSVSKETDKTMYDSDDHPGDDGSESVIVVNDHNVGVTIKNNLRKNRQKYEVSTRSEISESKDDLSQSELNKELSNSQSDVSEMFQKRDNFLPRTKLIKSNSNDVTVQYVARGYSEKEYQTWNPNLKLKETKKWFERDENNLVKEKSNNKMKDVSKTLYGKNHMQTNEKNTKYGPWYDLWGIDASVQS